MLGYSQLPIMGNILSVITACFNSERTIEATLLSILSQGYRPLEYIIVDGNSTDQTCQLIEKYSTNFSAAGIAFKWISESDTGIYNAWNKGLKLASGTWISFLGSDDIYYENSIEKYAKVIEDNPNHDFVTAKAKIMENGVLQRIFGEKFNWNVFKREMKILHAGGFLNRKYIDEYGVFNEDYKITGDYEMLLRKGKNLKVHVIDEVLVEMDAGGLSNTHVNQALNEAKQSKINTAHRNPLLANLEMFIVKTKITLKSMF